MGGHSTVEVCGVGFTLANTACFELYIHKKELLNEVINGFRCEFYTKESPLAGFLFTINSDFDIAMLIESPRPQELEILSVIISKLVFLNENSFLLRAFHLYHGASVGLYKSPVLFPFSEAYINN